MRSPVYATGAASCAIRCSQSRTPSPVFGLRGARLTGVFLKQRIHDIAFACFFFESWPYLMSMVLVIAITATVLAFVQNTVMFSLGMKEMAIFAFPLSFVGIFLAEVVLIWAAYFCIRRFLRRSRALVLAGWAIFVLGAAEPMLPASYFTTLVQHAKRKQVLDQIEQTGASIEPLASDQSSIRFALTYELKFPKAGHYLTFPAYLGPEGHRTFGNYFTKLHPEYYDENYVFNAGTPYSFTVVFDTDGKQFDFSKEAANIDICDGKDYFMACRIMGVGLEGVSAALTSHPWRREPAVPADNVRDITEKSIRLDGLKLKSVTNKAGVPVEFSYVITNVGDKDVVIAGNDFANVIGINYGWEAISDSATKTKITAGTVRFGSAVAAGGAQFTSVHKSNLAPGENVTFEDKIAPFEPLALGQYSSPWCKSRFVNKNF